MRSGVVQSALGARQDRRDARTDQQHRRHREDRDGRRGPIVVNDYINLDRRLQDVAWKYFETLLSHVNPHTGLAYKDRIFSAPVLSLSDPQWAVEELEWCIKHGAKVISMRNGPVYTKNGTTSPGAPEYDPFWARVQEANIVVAPHAGDDGYDFLGKIWEPWSDYSGFSVTPLRKVVTSQRAVPDFFAALVCHKVFERFPRLRVASIENGASWVQPLQVRLFRGHAQTKGYYKTNPVDQFNEHIWVTPFWVSFTVVPPEIATLGPPYSTNPSNSVTLGLRSRLIE